MSPRNIPNNYSQQCEQDNQAIQPEVDQRTNTTSEPAQQQKTEPDDNQPVLLEGDQLTKNSDPVEQKVEPDRPAVPNIFVQVENDEHVMIYPDSVSLIIQNLSY